MKNRSFLNKLAGVRGVLAACTAVAALSVVLLFVVCANNNNSTTPSCPSTQPDCPGYVDPCAGGATAACCNANPSYPGCTTNPPDPCVTNPGPNCPGYCTANPTAPGCPGVDPGTDPCVANPTAPGCPGVDPGTDPCVANPTAPGCTTTDPCENGASITCCNAEPRHEGCLCADDQVNIDNPACPGYIPPTDPCIANPTLPQCQSGPCDNGPGIACCAAQPTYPGCATTDKKYCRWDNDPTNCHEIGGAYSDTATATEATCKANFGEVVTDCNAVSQLEYCRWDGVCSPINDPTGPCVPACGDRTQRENCALYGEGGVHATLAACEAWVPSGPDYYCQWGGETGCVKLNNPDAIDPNNKDGLTYKANCEQNSFGLSTSPTCAGITVPVDAYYCDWGDGGCWEMKKPNDPCDSSSGACTGTAMEHCTKNGKVITCTGNDRPYDGACCAH